MPLWVLVMLLFWPLILELEFCRAGCQEEKVAMEDEQKSTSSPD